MRTRGVGPAHSLARRGVELVEVLGGTFVPVDLWLHVGHRRDGSPPDGPKAKICTAFGPVGPEIGLTSPSPTPAGAGGYAEASPASGAAQPLDRSSARCQSASSDSRSSVGHRRLVASRLAPHLPHLLQRSSARSRSRPGRRRRARSSRRSPARPPAPRARRPGTASASGWRRRRRRPSAPPAARPKPPPGRAPRRPSGRRSPPAPPAPGGRGRCRG